VRVIDISVPIYEGMPVYKNIPEKQPKIESKTNAHVTESRLHLDAHTGTHIDSPLHMINDGAAFETIAIEKLVGPCKVFDLTHVQDQITVSDLEGLDIQEYDFILFKTSNSLDEAFNFEFVFIGEQAAAYLAEKKVRGVGVDALGVERSQPGHPTHKALFHANIIEGLQLKEVVEGSYLLVAAPLKLIGTDASPARVLLIEGVTY